MHLARPWLNRLHSSLAKLPILLAREPSLIMPTPTGAGDIVPQSGKPGFRLKPQATRKDRAGSSQSQRDR